MDTVSCLYWGQTYDSKINGPDGEEYVAQPL
jgi:hypothetical protein